MNKKVIIYQTLQGKEIFRDWNCHFIPAKGQNISFKESDEKLCNLLPHERQFNYAVAEVTLIVPACMVVTVAKVV